MMQPSGFTIGGNLTGLMASETLVLSNNGDYVTLSGDGVFMFASQLPDASNYDVEVFEAPLTQSCMVMNGVGTVMGADVTNVEVACLTKYRLGGTVTGLAAGATVVLTDLREQLTVTGNGTFAFAGALVDGDNYDVSVDTQPSGQFCSVTNASGRVMGRDVDNVVVTCQ